MRDASLPPEDWSPFAFRNLLLLSSSIAVLVLACAVYLPIREVIVVSDGLRFWGFLSAMSGLPPSLKILGGVMHNHRKQVYLGPWAGLGILCFFLFLATAGGFIPIANRTWGIGDPLFQRVALVFWSFASCGGWFMVAALAPGKWFIATAAGLLLPMMLAASVLTYGV